MNNPLDLCGKDFPRFNQNRSCRQLLTQLRQFAGLGILVLLALIGNASITSAQVTTASATTLKQIRVARGPDATEINSVPWVNVPGASLGFTAEPGESYLFVMRYTAESVCSGTNAGWCSVRILVNGTEASPVVGYDFAFDSNDAGTASSQGWKGHAVDRSYHYINNGTKATTLTAVVQYAVTDDTIDFRLDDWQFTVEQFQ